MPVRLQKLHPDDQLMADDFKPRPRKSAKKIGEDRQLVVEDARRVASYFERCVREEMIKRKDDIETAMKNRAYDRGARFLATELPFRVNCDAMIDRLTPAETQYRAELLRKGGVGLHENQIRTLVAMMIESSLELTKPGVIVGPMQSGKTGLALAIALFMAPLMYQLAGVKFFPLFLSTHLDVHAEQTKKEFEAVLSLYGDLEIEVSSGRITPGEYYNLINVLEDHYRDHASGFTTEADLDAVYDQEPSPRAYRNVIMRDKLTQSADDIQIVYNRRNGRQVDLLRKRMADLIEAGFSLLLLVDEPQYGASGPLTPIPGKLDLFGRQKFKGVVIKQIMNDYIDDLLSQDGRHMAIMVSATPFDTAQMAGTWTQLSYLSPNYVGYNCWQGQKIDENVWLRTPVLRSFSDMVTATGNDDVANLRTLLGCGKKDADYAAATPALLQTLDYLFNSREEIAEEVAFLRPDLEPRLDHMLTEAHGGCIRFVSDNAKTNEIITQTGLEQHYQVFRYFGGQLIDQDRRQTLTTQEVLERHWDKSDPRPPLFVVTNLARMGDNFPRMIEVFVDLAGTASDMNSLLQGLNGRACGESKFFSQVMLSDDSIRRLRDYVANLGVTGDKGSRHSVTVNGTVVRGRGHKMARVTTLGNSDPLVAKFMRMINEHIVWKRFADKTGNRVPQGKLPAKPAPYYDMCSILEAVRDDQGRNFIEYLSDPDVQSRLFPNMEYMPIANPLDPHTSLKLKGEAVKYVHAADGTTKLSFRTRPTPEIDSGHYGIADRDQRRAAAAQTDRAISTSGLEIQINVMKRKSLRANAAEVLKAEEQGYPEAYMVTFPLLRETRPKTVIVGTPSHIAKENGWVAGLATDEERAWLAARSEATAARSAAKKKAAVA